MSFTLTHASTRNMIKINKSTASRIPQGNSYLSKKFGGIDMSLDKLNEDGVSRNASINIRNIFNFKKLG